LENKKVFEVVGMLMVEPLRKILRFKQDSVDKITISPSRLIDYYDGLMKIEDTVISILSEGFTVEDVVRDVNTSLDVVLEDVENENLRKWLIRETWRATSCAICKFYKVYTSAKINREVSRSEE